MIAARVVADAHRRNEQRCSKRELSRCSDGTRQELRFARPTKLVREDSAADHPITAFIGLDKIKADAKTAAKLALRVGTQVLVVKRALVFGGRPLIFDQIHLANADFPGLNMAALEASRGSIYSFLETAYGVRMIRADEKIKAVAADRVSAKYLKVPIGTPLLSVDRVAYTYGDKPVEWRRGLCLTDGYSYINELA